MSGWPWWLTWAGAMWTAGDATVERAVWASVMFEVFALWIVWAFGYGIFAEEPDGELIQVAFFVTLIGGLMWPVVAVIAVVAGTVAAVVMPARHVVHRGRRRRAETAAKLRSLKALEHELGYGDGEDDIKVFENDARPTPITPNPGKVMHMHQGRDPRGWQ